MSNPILIGYEQVERAGHMMVSAAESIERSVSSLHDFAESMARLQLGLADNRSSEQPGTKAQGQDFDALMAIANEMRRRTVGPPQPKPVLGVELHEWAERIVKAAGGVVHD